METKYVAKIFGEYLWNQEPGTLGFTADIKKAGLFDSFEAAEGTCESQYPGEPFEVIAVRQATPE